jgi:hypothetical protein
MAGNRGRPNSIITVIIYTCVTWLGIIINNICSISSIKLTYSIQCDVAATFYHYYFASSTPRCNVPPKTECEARLQEALHSSNAVVIAGMQAQMVLHSIYLKSVWGQLQAQELKKFKKRKTRKINMDGQAKILTQDDIIEEVKE